MDSIDEVIEHLEKNYEPLDLMVTLFISCRLIGKEQLRAQKMSNDACDNLLNWYLDQLSKKIINLSDSELDKVSGNIYLSEIKRLGYRIYSKDGSVILEQGS